MREKIDGEGQELRVQDGDSFQLGPRRLRLDGIDAPEYRQTCKDAQGKDWDCGKAARAALEKLLREPGLTCEQDAADRYGRAIASCRTAATPDISAAQVRDGMAVSRDFAGIRDYGDEEDAAREAKRGIWTGRFLNPEDWRTLNKLNSDQAIRRTNTVPAE
ncbi:MAG: thermonuclease family protein [Sphingorhabdus sp.]